MYGGSAGAGGLVLHREYMFAGCRRSTFGQKGFVTHPEIGAKGFA